MQVNSTAHTHTGRAASRQKAWSLFRREWLYWLWAAMEAALITPAALLFMNWTAPFAPIQLFGGVFLLMLLPFYLARLLAWLGYDLKQQRLYVAIAAFLVIFFTVRAIGYNPQSLFDMRWIGQFFRNLAITNDDSWQRDFGVFALVAFSWWRGILLVTREADVSRLGQRFRRSGLIIVPFLSLVASFQQTWSVLQFFMLFFATGLSAMALTRVEQAERRQEAILASLTPRWLTAVTVGSLGLVAFVGFTAVLTSGNWGTAAAGIFAPVWNGVRLGAAVVGLTAAYLASPFLGTLETGLQALIRLVQALFAALFTATEQPTEQSAETGARLMEDFNRWLLEHPPSQRTFINWRIVLLIVLVLAVITAVYALGRYYNGNKLAGGGNRFSQIVRDISMRFTPGRARREKQKMLSWRQWQTAVSIMRIYEQMLAAAAAMDHSRPDTVTPYEFIGTLAQIWPTHRAEIVKITQAYVRAKYGEVPETKAELDEIKQAWQRLETAETAVFVP